MFDRKRKNGDEFIAEKERELIDSGKKEDIENYENREERSNYAIKILIPTDKFSCEYRAFFVTENENYTPDIEKSKTYYTFDSAVDDAKYFTDKFKKDKIWCPTFVCRKKGA